MILFFIPSVSAGYNDFPLYLAGYTDENAWHAPRDRSLPSLTIAYALALSVGTISVQLQKNGLNVGAPALLSPTQHLDTVDLNAYLSPGDHITCLITCSADLIPTLQPLVAIIP